MNRSLKKGIFTSQEIIDLILEKNLNTPESKEVINTQKRNITIVPEMVNCLFGIHDGRKYIIKRISNEMIGLKLGELVITRKVKEHTKVTKNSRKKVKK